MVSRQERDRALEIVGPFLRGEVDNIAMEEHFSRNNPFWKTVTDPAVHAFSSSIGFWDDGEDIYLLPERVSRLEHDLAERWIAFLESDLEYDWPKADLSRWRQPWWKNIVALPLIFVVLPIFFLMAIIFLPYRLIRGQWPRFQSNGDAPDGVMFSDPQDFEAYLRKRMGKKRSRDLDLTNWPFHDSADMQSQKI